MSSGFRHLFAAVLVLSTDTETIDMRLRKVYENCLRRIQPSVDLPAHLVAEYQALMNELNNLFREGERVVDRQRASRLAERVVQLYDGVRAGL